MANLKSVKLDSSNYIVWTHQITSIIKTYSLIQHLDNSIPILGQYPRDSNSKGNFMNQVNLEFETWQILDQALVTLINSTLTPSIFYVVVGFDYAIEAWRTLEKRLTSSSHPNILNLKIELHSITKVNDSMNV